MTVRSAAWSASATITAVSGIASTSLRNGRCQCDCSISPSTSSPSRNRITISATVARSETNRERGVEVQHAGAAVAEHEAGDHEHRRQRHEACAGPDRETSAPSDQQPAERERAATFERCDTAPQESTASACAARPTTVSSVRPGQQRGAECRSPCWGSHRRGRTPPGHAAATWCRRASSRCCSTAATACSPSCAGSCDYVDVDAVLITHMHADHFLDLVPFSYALRYAPRQQPVPVAAGPAPRSPRVRAVRARTGGRGAAPRSSALGQRRPDRDAFDLHEYAARRRADDSGRCRCAFARCRTTSATFAVELRRDGARFTFGADCAPNEELVEFARDTDLLMIEATLPRPSATAPAGTSPRARPASTAAARPRAAAGADPLLRRDGSRAGLAAEARRQLRRPGRAGAEGAVYTV